MGHTGSISTTAGLFCPSCHASKDSAVIWHPYLSTISTKHCWRLLACMCCFHYSHFNFPLSALWLLPFCFVYQFFWGVFFAEGGTHFCPSALWKLSKLACVRVFYFFMAVSCVASGLLKRKWCSPASARNHVFCSSEPKTHTHTCTSKHTSTPTEDKSFFFKLLFVCLCRIHLRWFYGPQMGEKTKTKRSCTCFTVVHIILPLWL